MINERQRRRNVLKAAAGAAVVTLAAAPRAVLAAEGTVTKKVYRSGPKPKTPPLFSGAVSYGNLLFLAGVGAHFEGDIKAHTKHVIDEIEKTLKQCGSSMDKVLKCNVYLNDLKDYDGMNEVFRGRFGDDPPVRTTIAAAGGIPGKSLVEIDVIAHL
jgi:2-iminobutanoate/2-iminopropanoate deaminase